MGHYDRTIGKIRRAESSLPKNLVTGNKEITEIKDITEEFNNSFANAGSNLTKMF